MDPHTTTNAATYSGKPTGPPADQADKHLQIEHSNVANKQLLFLATSQAPSVQMLPSRMLSSIPIYPNPDLLQIFTADHNAITQFDALKRCPNLIEISLSNNLINALPPIFSSLSVLQILRLDNNQISSWRDTTPLKDSKLIYLNLEGNAFTKNEKYRPFVVNMIETLKGLDSYAISEEELMDDDAGFPVRYKVKPNLTLATRR